MLTISNLSKRFAGADAPVLQNVSFTVNPGERVGLIGPNGCGKTTLLRIVMGQLSPDGGSVQFSPPDLRVGYLPQGLDVPDDTPLRDVLYPLAAALREAEAEVERLAAALADAGGPNLDAPMAAYAAALDRLETLSRQVDSGESERILAGLVARGANLLVLDEPINHLDAPSREKFEEALAVFQGSVLAVVHDRYFVDKFAATVWHIENGALAVQVREPLLACPVTLEEDCTMQTYSRPYQHNADFWRIRELLITTYPRNQNRHNWEIRRWEGWCLHRDEDDALIGDRPWQATVRIWETAAGDLVGAVHPEGPGWIFLEIHPDFRHLEDEMIAWGEEHLAVPGPDGGQQAYLDVYEYDTLRQSLLVRRGYEQLPGFGAYRRRWMDQPIPAVAIPDGYTVRTLRDDDADCQRFADLLNAAFGRTFHTAEELRRFHQSPSYRSDLDIVIEALDGTLAATAGVTYDEANRVGTFEPVCTHPDHLRRKLAQAAMVEGLRRLAALGAVMAEVGTGDMVAANRLYESLGFTDVDIDHAWRKVW